MLTRRHWYENCCITRLHSEHVQFSIFWHGKMQSLSMTGYNGESLNLMTVLWIKWLVFKGSWLEPDDATSSSSSQKTGKTAVEKWARWSFEEILKRLAAVRGRKPAQEEGGDTKAAGRKRSVLSQRTIFQPKGSIQNDEAVEARIHAEDLSIFVQAAVPLTRLHCFKSQWEEIFLI